MTKLSLNSVGETVKAGTGAEKGLFVRHAGCRVSREGLAGSEGRAEAYWHCIGASFHADTLSLLYDGVYG